MDQPTAKDALKALEPLVGEWEVTAIGPDGQPWPGQGRSVFEWHDSRAHLRFTARFEDGGQKIVGRWEKAVDGTAFETDFDLTYTRLD